jgi:indolepyruvate ferredoxin oxidoreductase
MVSGTASVFPALGETIGRIEAATRAERALFLDAGALAEALFGDHMPANVIMLGAAYQHGCLPVSADAIRGALELNGASVATNLAAFDWGRAAAIDPGAVTRASTARSATRVTSSLDAAPPRAVAQRIDAAPLPAGLRELLTRRAADLTAYQDVAYARRYVDDVLEVLAAERERSGAGDELPVTDAYARAMHKLMAYKDEYEVARLHLEELERARLQDEFGPGAEVQILLHPPMLRALGLRRKLRLGMATARPLFGGLRAGRRLRGTALDPFGHTELRRLERALIEEHRALVRRALPYLTAHNQAAVAAVAALPDVIRGYEAVKLQSVARYRAAAAEAVRELAAAPAEPVPAG